MKTILLLTDFSQNSINAIRYALKLFKEKKMLYYLLHVKSATAFTSDDLVAAGGKPIYEALITPAKKRLSTLADSLQREFELPNNSMEYVVDFDILTNAIQQIIASKNIDTIVMGTNGATGAQEVIFGSNTINVIRKVDCPTLVIPEGFEYRPPKNTVLPMDDETSLNDLAFKDGILNFVKTFGSSLHILRIHPHGPKGTDIKEEADQRVLKTLKDPVNFQYHVVNNVPVYYASHCYMQTNPIDLVTLITHREHFFERYLSTSSTARISNNLIVPLLIFHSN